MTFSKFLKIVLPVIIFISIFFASICFGTERFSLSQIFHALFSNTKEFSLETLIIKDIRLPRIFLAFLCGSLLAGSGAVFQGYFRNPLADSGIMGISSGATLGAVLSALIPLSSISVPVFVQGNLTALCAFAGALAVSILIYATSRIFAQRSDSTAVILTGTAMSAFFSAITSFLLLIKDRELYRMFSWTLGSFNGKTWQDFFLVLPVSFITVIMLFICTNFLDILGAGLQTAKSLGLNPVTTRRLVLTAGSLASACAVCIGGTISFVGLIAPHIVRRIYTPKHRFLVPVSMLFGGIFLVLADTISRALIPPAEIPVGIITALIGSPFFISMLISSEGKNHD